MEKVVFCVMGVESSYELGETAQGVRDQVALLVPELIQFHPVGTCMGHTQVQ